MRKEYRTGLVYLLIFTLFMSISEAGEACSKNQQSKCHKKNKEAAEKNISKTSSAHKAGYYAEKTKENPKKDTKKSTDAQYMKNKTSKQNHEAVKHSAGSHEQGKTLVKVSYSDKYKDKKTYDTKSTEKYKHTDGEKSKESYKLHDNKTNKELEAYKDDNKDSNNKEY